MHFLIGILVCLQCDAKLLGKRCYNLLETCDFALASVKNSVMNCRDARLGACTEEAVMYTLLFSNFVRVQDSCNAVSFTKLFLQFFSRCIVKQRSTKVIFLKRNEHIEKNWDFDPSSAARTACLEN